MVRIENRCCDCASGLYPCRGSSCSLRHVKICYCDRCGEEIGSEEDKYDSYNGDDLCEACFEEEQEALMW